MIPIDYELVCCCICIDDLIFFINIDIKESRCCNHSWGSCRLIAGKHVFGVCNVNWFRYIVIYDYRHELRPALNCTIFIEFVEFVISGIKRRPLCQRHSIEISCNLSVCFRWHWDPAFNVRVCQRHSIEICCNLSVCFRWHWDPAFNVRVLFPVMNNARTILHFTSTHAILGHVAFIWKLWIMNINCGITHWSDVNFISGNGLVLLGNKPLPEPMLPQIYIAVWRH